MSDALLPCPFCGKPAYIWAVPGYVQSSTFKVSCENDCVSMPARRDTFFTSRAEAAKAWNRRASPAPDALREALEALLSDEMAMEGWGIGPRKVLRQLLDRTASDGAALRSGDGCDCGRDVDRDGDQIHYSPCPYAERKPAGDGSFVSVIELHRGDGVADENTAFKTAISSFAATHPNMDRYAVQAFSAGWLSHRGPAGDGWTRVEDGPPTETGWYLCSANGNVVPAWYSVDGKDWWEDGDFPIRPSYWRPLPPAPEEK